MTSFEQRLREKIIVLDGATGSNLQLMNLTADDFGGEALNGCNEHLVLTRPDAIEQLHASFLSVGCDAIETNTFGATVQSCGSCVLECHVVGGAFLRGAETNGLGLARL